MFDLTKLKELKEKQLISVAKVGASFAVEIKQFDPQTGSELDPIVESISIDQLSKIKSQAQILVKNADEVIADLEKL